MVPILISVEGVRVTVFGGGHVALRKCRHFDGADLTVVSNEVIPELGSIAGSVVRRMIDNNVIIDSIRNADMVIAATDEKTLNDKICAMSKEKGIPVNSAHGGGTVLIPSMLRRDRYVVAVSTEGKVPAFPPYLIDNLDSLLDARFDMMFDLLADSRSRIKDKGDQKARSNLLRMITRDETILNALENGDHERASSRAKEMEAFL